jgi:hypothetical protein
MFESRRGKSLQLFTAVAALYQTLFNIQTSPPNLSNAVHVDTLKNWRLSDSDISGQKKIPNIVATFDFVNLIGWKYHEKQ